MSIQPTEASDAATLNEHGYRLWLAGTIQKILKDRGITEAELADKAVLPLAQVRRIVRGDLAGELTLRAIIRISNALDIQIRMSLAVPVPAAVNAEQMIPYSFQLRRGMVVHISLPEDFCSDDAYRLYNFLQVLPAKKKAAPAVGAHQER